jgi:CheY-like chemotaxis protein
VLVVEDNRDVASAMGLLLEMLGHRAEIAESGLQALALTEDWCPGLALLDVGLPDMDGLELARRLRARYPDPATMRLIAVTGFGHEEARERSLAAGFDEHLAKPVELATLQRLLEPLR